MGIWYFWERYAEALALQRCPYYPGCHSKDCTRCWEQDPLDKFPVREVQKAFPNGEATQGREILQVKKISRFLSAIRRMPKAWGEKSWTPRQMQQAANNVASETFRRKLKRDLERGSADS